MTDIIAPPFSVVVQGIDALENTETQHGHLMALMRHRAMLAAAPQPPAVKESLTVEQPQGEQEPVAWLHADGKHQPLYTHPQNLNCKSTQARLATLWGYEKPQPNRQPLTDKQIDAIMMPLTKNQPYSWRKFARAIERAHGIGGDA